MKKQWKWYVYIVECLDGTYYTGCTWNILNRMEQHISRLGSKYTQKHGFKQLVYFEEHNNLENARLREKQVKNWNQEKKRKLIDGEWKKDW
ncbi:GIY-YIG nuclease family protein [Candidatus Daviesbacteria bacterium]|nr:GIY-YIG nuclease family protein [Candidatus Daviesbacteria bacterium]